VDTFVDHGVSGSREKRPALDRMMAEARKGKFDILLVWRSDRLFRSLRHMVNTLAELDSMGISFVSVTEPFDGTTPQGKLLIHLVSAFSEFERQVLIERTRAGLAAARRRGARIGRPRLEVDREELVRLREVGMSLRVIAQKLGLGVTSVQRMLRGPVPSDPKAFGSGSLDPASMSP